ncbi:cysteine desulfurase family protein [Pedobacter gandavensis]|uniref:Aminotransferase class V-fold PLP-dependent enzyme n=1 Tax=Pedobacter gandavensis TaxID=2679963 RepID=A0ABR6EVL2_9SPHI|nr:cysteine desulfurase family protein [Pedobacter gandavensis]MBB2149231.1 aminotransferase class V-fold PLP-dependent enzyme [Pedobacter gandavensis]
MRIYLDNAATTPLNREVFLAMEPYFFENFGNPSSSHHHGRSAKVAIAQARGIIADLLNASPDHIVFTSGGSEADNTAIISGIRSNGIKLAITSAFEHHAVLHTLQALEKNGEIRIAYLQHDALGNLSLGHLEQLLGANERAFVSVMHGNNEIGNLNDIEAIAEICKRYRAVFHSDTVQSMGQYRYDTRQLNADFLVGSAHKFHGPKGVGFLYRNTRQALYPLINGGAQEQKQRAGTENVTGIVGLAKALEISYRNREVTQQHLIRLKERLIYRLKDRIADIDFNGNSANTEKSLNSVLSVSLPDPQSGIQLLSHLDQHQISVSGGSACNSHSAAASHVLNALGTPFGRSTIRFSFSRYNTEEELDYAVEKLAKCYTKVGISAYADVF